MIDFTAKEQRRLEALNFAVALEIQRAKSLDYQTTSTEVDIDSVISNAEKLDAFLAY